MKAVLSGLAGLAFFLAACRPEQTGLLAPVEIVRDSIGINHIYAQNEHDLFYAQGYAAAGDRLFQFELWRRQATGTVAEILGPRELHRDVGARLFRFRGNLDEEFAHYHSRGKEIIEAFTRGVNARIAEALSNPALLPVEFKLLGILPGYWTAEVVISRHQGLLGNLEEEVNLAHATALLGAEKVKSLLVFEPGEAKLLFDTAVHRDAAFDSIIYLYRSFRQPIRFRPEDVAGAARAADAGAIARELTAALSANRTLENNSVGSNNWVVNGSRSVSGYPLLANDPHRAIAVPSLRYMVHLHAPGWNVMGAGEPTIPGVSIGHNHHGTWGLTVFSLDGEDLYQYRLHPKNPDQYWNGSTWTDFSTVSDTIPVKGESPRVVVHRYTRHGPVVFLDTAHRAAYAVRAAWLEPGCAPYLASLRMDQAKNWTEFQQACTYNRIPGENMIWADREGNIGWQAAGIAPVRKNWDGLIPVPGDGRYEWSGYLPVDSLPSVYNPDKGYWATANENLAPPGYRHTQAISYVWAARYRADRIDEVLKSEKKFSAEDMKALQNDYLSLPARQLTALLRPLRAANPQVEAMRRALAGWDCVLAPGSIEAGMYVAWERTLVRAMWNRQVPEAARKYIRSLPLPRVIDGLLTRKAFSGSTTERNAFLLACLADARLELVNRLGDDPAGWFYGQEKYHHVRIRHPLSSAVNDSLRAVLEVGPLPRGGYGYTPGMTSNSDNQASGASFRMVVDVGDWDATWVTNTPGQSGNPASPFYKNLFGLWANDRYARAPFSREAVNRMAIERIWLKPK
jgi:penicillin amidase